MSTETEVHEGQTLQSSTTAYSILQFIGEGVFGKVAKCRNLQTGETVAVKVLKNDPELIQDAEHEVSILKTISVLDPDSINVVKFFEQFDYMENTCLAFEMLEANLYDLFDHNGWEPVHIRGIRPIAKQLFVALAALKTFGILHTDIKPDNIMIVREQEESVRVKLIDFGLAFPASEVEPGMECQPYGYRAPEVSLGLPFTEAIDVWAVGCILGFLYLAQNFFPVLCEYHMMKRMVELLGVPAEYLLWSGKYTQHFFAIDETNWETWRLVTPEEYAQRRELGEEELDTSRILPTSLDDMMNVYPQNEAGETEDTKAFVDLMKGLLHLDGSLRLTPDQALQHPFITMSHLSHDVFGDYFRRSQLKMGNCQDTGVDTCLQEDTDSWDPSSHGEVSDGSSCEDELPSDSRCVEFFWGQYGLQLQPQSWNSDVEQADQSHHEAPENWSMNGDEESDQDDQGDQPHPGHPENWSMTEDQESDEDDQADQSHPKTPENWSLDGERESSVDHEDIQSRPKTPENWSLDEDRESDVNDEGIQSHPKTPENWSLDGEREFDVDDEGIQSHTETLENWSSDGDQEPHVNEETAADSPPVTSSRSLRKRFLGFFRSLKRRALKSCCCCLSPAED